jgi:cytochrome P450
MLSPYVTHHRADLWPDPERFDPERFAGDKAAAPGNFAYFPFGGGPRLCIGSSFALMEAQLLLATLAARARPELVPGVSAELDPTITLRPKGGLKLILRP